jgi:hypothetical protein
VGGCRRTVCVVTVAAPPAAALPRAVAIPLVGLVAVTVARVVAVPAPIPVSVARRAVRAAVPGACVFVAGASPPRGMVGAAAAVARVIAVTVAVARA